MTPTFYDNPRGFNSDRVDFGISVDGQVIPCSISFEALSDHFGSDSIAAAMVECYVRNRERIDAKATALFRIAQATGNAGFTAGDRLIVKTAYL